MRVTMKRVLEYSGWRTATCVLSVLGLIFAAGSAPATTPNDSQDPGSNNIVQVQMIAGDDSGSDSEEYDVIVYPKDPTEDWWICLSSPEGQLATSTVTLVKGKAYDMMLVHKGGRNDFDYTWTVDGVGLRERGELGSLTGREKWFVTNGLVINDEKTLLGVYGNVTGQPNNTAPFYAQHDKITVYILKVDIEPTWDIVTEGDDSEDFKATVTPTGLSGLTYAWTWQTITNGGNTPSVTFTAPSAATTQVDRAHWYAVPDARCASNQVCDYRLWCTAIIGGVDCSNYATVSVELVDPAAETVPEYNLTGGPSVAYNAASNWWYVSGTGTLARSVVLTTNWWLHADSEFTAKLQAHENQHSQDLVNGFDGHTFVTVPEFYARISAFTDPTSTGLVSKISAEYVLYMTDEEAELLSLVDGLEVRAYNVSDGVTPDYYYSNCGRFTYP